jgi:putative phage-type endonuclease
VSFDLQPLDELQAFQETQQKGIGSTDAAGILNVSPWATPFSVWESKMGLSPVRKPNLPMWLGKRLETIVADLYRLREGVELRYEGDRQYKRKGEPWQVTHLDFRVKRKPRHIVEIKTAHNKDGWGEPGSGDVPLHYWLQVQHQMAVVQGEQADLAVLFGLGWGFEVYRIARDSEYIKKLTEAEREFWFTYCVPGVPPPVDHTDAARRFLQRRNPKDDGNVLPATPEQAELVDRYRLADHNVRQAEQERDRLQNKIIEAIGPASGLRGPGFEVTYKRSKDGKPSVAWDLVWQGAKALLSEAGIPETDERLTTLVSLYTTPGKEGSRRWHLGDRKE